MTYANAFKACFPNNTLGWPIIGREEAIRSITIDDIRNYWKKMYQPNNLIISVVGRVNQKKALTTVNNAFGELEAGPRAAYEKLLVSPEKKKKESSRFPRVYPTKKDETHFALCNRTVSALDPDYASLAILNKMVAGSRRSPLYRKLITELGYASLVTSTYEVFPDTGIFVVLTSTPPKNAKKTFEIMQQETRLLADKGPTKEMVDIGKSQLSGEIVIELEDNFNLSLWYIQTYLRHKKLKTPNAFLTDLQSITPEIIHNQLKEIFSPDQVHMIMLGKIPQGLEKEELYKLS
jgi:predicted Zn-dependent peptidase